MDDRRDLQMARRIAGEVAAAGGRTFFVGGFVRDVLLERENKDIDIEVHGIAPETLRKILDGLGERMEMGASFGIFGLKDYDLDIAMPRRETANGRGHRDFEIDVDPFLGTKKAAMRRDFTMNALMQDVLTGEIVDHFGGVRDIRDGVVRHVNDATFAEDPLRPLRAAQFAARFEFAVAPETVRLSRRIDLSALPRERVFGELQKALMKSAHPSVFFRVLREMNQLAGWFPVEMIGLEQERAFHPEGDVFNHTMLTLDAAAFMREDAENPLGFMLAALCHDFGKVTATQVIDGRIRALGHEKAGLPVAEAFLSRLTGEVRLHKYVLNMVELHMRPNLLAAQGAGAKAMARLFDESVCPEDLLLLARADRMGQLRDDEEAEARLREQLALFRERMAEPYVMGADLVAAGFAPCQAFGKALEYAHRLRLAGVKKEQALPQTIACLKRLLAAKG